MYTKVKYSIGVYIFVGQIKSGHTFSVTNQSIIYADK